MAKLPSTTDQPDKDKPPLPDIKKEKLKLLADDIGDTPDEPGKDNSFVRAGELLDATVQYYHDLEVGRRASRGVAGQMPNVKPADVVRGRVQQTLDALPVVVTPVPDPPKG